MTQSKNRALSATMLLLTVGILTACRASSQSTNATPTTSVEEANQTTHITSPASSTQENQSTEMPTSSVEIPRAAEGVQIEEFPMATMDIAEVAKGNYSSVIGTWQNSEGSVLVFNRLGLTNGMKIAGEGQLIDGIFETYAGSDSGTGSGALLLVPQNAKFKENKMHETQDISDHSKDRLFAVQSLLTAEGVERHAYYRIRQIDPSQKNPLENKETGITLESGQVSLDYATLILGPGQWSALESNYGRTEAIPFELVTAENDQEYRIYQNGVIVSEQLQKIIYIP